MHTSTKHRAISIGTNKATLHASLLFQIDFEVLREDVKRIYVLCVVFESEMRVVSCVWKDIGFSTVSCSREQNLNTKLHKTNNTILQIASPCHLILKKRSDSNYLTEIYY